MWSGARVVCGGGRWVLKVELKSRERKGGREKGKEGKEKEKEGKEKGKEWKENVKSTFWLLHSTLGKSSFNSCCLCFL